MKRICVFMVLLAGCANNPAETYAYCQRWSAKYLAFGNHANPDFYREDLMSTCMALKKTPYDTQQSRITSASAWANPSLSEPEFTRTIGSDIADCIERGYVGQVSQGSNRAQIGGYGGIVGGSQSENYNSGPVFNNDLFVACMNGAGWELINPGAR